MHVLDGKHAPAQVKEFIAKRYNDLCQEMAAGCLAMPNQENPGGVLVEPTFTSNCKC